MKDKKFQMVIFNYTCGSNAIHQKLQYPFLKIKTSYKLLLRIIQETRDRHIKSCILSVLFESSEE